jgi:hypothetical protein
MTTLLVAKNDKSSLELMRFIDRLIQDGDSAIRNKISRVVKGKDKTKTPAIIRSDGEVMTDINQIYLYLSHDNRDNRDYAPSRGGKSRHDRSDEQDYNYDDNFNYDDILDREIDHDEKGNIVRGEDADNQQVSRRRRKGDDSEEEVDPRINLSELTEKFNNRRGGNQAKLHRRKPRDEQPSPPPKRRSKKKYESSEESEESDDSDGGLDRYMNQVVHSKD